MEMGGRLGLDDPKKPEASMDNAAYREKYKHPDWRSIINTDIKLENVVLCDPTEEYPAYPVAKMTDFGLCARPRKPTMKFKFTSRPGGTRGHEPPVRI